MKGLIGLPFLRSVSRSKLFRFSAAFLLVLVLYLSLIDKLPTVKYTSEHSRISRSSLSKSEIINVILPAAKPSFTSREKTPEISHTNQSHSNHSVKILCYVLLSRSRVKVARMIKETWGSHCDYMLFFGGYKYPELPVTFVNVSEGYENLWGKSKAAILYLAENVKYKHVDYFLKADDDTFVIVENLRKFIRNATQPVKKPIWFGFKLKHKRMPKGYMSGGAGYVFNHAALARVGSILRKENTPTVDDNHPRRMEDIIGTCNVDGEYGVEDLELGKCFLNAGVDSLDTIDENYGERFLPLSYEVLLNGAISSFHWIWSQAWHRIRTGETCCSQDLISMHEISPSQMKTMYYLLYKIHIPLNKS